MIQQTNALGRLRRVSRHLRSLPVAQPSTLLKRSLSSNTPKHYKYLVLGGGNASGYAAKEFVDQQAVTPGDIGIITAEPVCPYERPALTKAYLHPPQAKVRARLPGFHTSVGGGGDRQDEKWYKEKGIDMLTGKTVVSIDCSKHVVNIQGGGVLSYDKLLFATGARPISLRDIKVPGSELRNVFTLRNENDASQLVSALESTTGDAVIIGGGYIGMECAAAISGWGRRVTMVFPEGQIMERLFPKEVAAWFEEEFKKRGIDLMKKATVTELKGSNGTVEQAVLSNGTVLNAGIVVAGLGARPNTELLKGQVELGKDGGVLVGGNFQSSNGDIYAFGDVAAFPHAYSDGALRRFEHVSHCRQSASHMVKCLLGKEKSSYTYLPFFYSRLFEYTDSPAIFQFYGEQTLPNGSALATESFVQGGTAGAVWLDGNRTVRGAMLINGTNEQFDALKQTVAKTSKLTSSPEELLL